MAYSEEAHALLKRSVYAAPLDTAGVVHAMRALEIPDAYVNIGLDSSLTFSDASRFLSLIDYPSAKTKSLIRLAAFPRSSPPHTSTARLIELVLATQKQSSVKGKVDRERKKLLSTPEAKRSLAYALERERSTLEEARRYEEAAKQQLPGFPAWAAKSKRATANDAKTSRIHAEDEYLKRLGN